MKLPDNYPYKVPDFSFEPAHPPYHPCVMQDGAEKGNLSPTALGLPDGWFQWWKSIAHVIKQLIQMLTSPKDFVGHALVAEVAAELTDRELQFKTKASASGR